VFKLFKKKKMELPKLWAVIDYSEKAKELCVGGKQNLRIYIYKGKYLVEDMVYSEGREEELKKRGIPVVWRAISDVPIECVEEPVSFRLFGRMRWK